MSEKLSQAACLFVDFGGAASLLLPLLDAEDLKKKNFFMRYHKLIKWVSFFGEFKGQGWWQPNAEKQNMKTGKTRLYKPVLQTHHQLEKENKNRREKEDHNKE